jgi:predicted nucleic acid-binding protein
MIHGIDTSMLVASELASHPRHASSRALLARLDQAGHRLALAPQVLAEFVHIVTDPRRCEAPLDMVSAVLRAEQIWNATEVIHVFPDASATSQFLAWMRQHRLGRKRLLDTMLAATYSTAGIAAVVTLNRADFDVFASFAVVEP